jgi:hypothetical protein
MYDTLSLKKGSTEKFEFYFWKNKRSPSLLSKRDQLTARDRLIND